MNIEKASHYSVVFIAVLALVVSIWQVRLGQHHNKLSVKPYLDFHIDQSDSTITVSFSNEGFGPAILQHLEFRHDGETFSSLEDYLMSSREIHKVLRRYNYSENTVISSGKEKLLVELKGNQTRGVQVKMEYIDIYETKGFFEFAF